MPYDNNARAILVSCVALHIGLVQMLCFISERPKRWGIVPKPLLQGLQAYSDTWYREADMMMGQLIGLVLLAVGILPFGFIHSRILFNEM